MRNPCSFLKNLSERSSSASSRGLKNTACIFTQIAPDLELLPVSQLANKWDVRKCFISTPFSNAKGTIPSHLSPPPCLFCCYYFCFLVCFVLFCICYLDSHCFLGAISILNLARVYLFSVTNISTNAYPGSSFCMYRSNKYLMVGDCL